MLGIELLTVLDASIAEVPNAPELRGILQLGGGAWKKIEMVPLDRHFPMMCRADHIWRLKTATDDFANIKKELCPKSESPPLLAQRDKAPPPSILKFSVAGFEFTKPFQSSDEDSFLETGVMSTAKSQAVHLHGVSGLIIWGDGLWHRIIFKPSDPYWRTIRLRDGIIGREAAKAEFERFVELFQQK